MTVLPGLVHVILPVHNRREITLRCLRHLQAIGVSPPIEIIVVDDGSTDGTAAAVHAEFPGVTVLPGNGHLFWSGAIEMGTRHAMQAGTACCVWLNDDSHPVPGAVERVVRYALAHRCIAAGLGRFVGSGSGDPSMIFHLLRRTAWGLQPFSPTPDEDGMIAVDACRGNLVAVPREVIERIGYPDAVHLPQYLGDTDYTLRATRAGFRCAVDPLAVVEEREHSGNWDESWLTTSRPLRQLWRRFATRQSSLYWRARWVYLRRHWGAWRGLLMFVSPYLRLALISLARTTLPAAWIRRVRAGKRVDTKPAGS